MTKSEFVLMVLNVVLVCVLLTQIFPPTKSFVAKHSDVFYLAPVEVSENETMFFTEDGKYVKIRNDTSGLYERSYELGTAWDTRTVIKEWGGAK